MTLIRRLKRVACHLWVDSEEVDEGLCSGDVTSSWSEALGEGSHHDVDVARIHLEVVNNAATSRAHCTDLLWKKHVSNYLLFTKILGRQMDGWYVRLVHVLKFLSSSCNDSTEAYLNSNKLRTIYLTLKKIKFHLMSSPSELRPSRGRRRTSSWWRRFPATEQSFPPSSRFPPQRWRSSSTDVYTSAGTEQKYRILHEM